MFTDKNFEKISTEVFLTVKIYFKKVIKCPHVKDWYPHTFWINFTNLIKLQVKNSETVFLSLKIIFDENRDKNKFLT